jgi:hypothetical protein
MEERIIAKIKPVLSHEKIARVESIRKIIPDTENRLETNGFTKIACGLVPGEVLAI